MVVGSGWKKESKDGGKYLSCVIQLPFIGEMNFTIFPTKEKKSDKSPDYNIVWSFKKPQSGGTLETKESPFGDEEIPF